MINLDNFNSILKKSLDLKFILLLCNYLLLCEIIFVHFLNINLIKLESYFVESNIKYFLLSFIIFAFYMQLMKIVIKSILIYFKEDLSFPEKGSYYDEDIILKYALHKKNILDYKYIKAYKKDYKNYYNSLIYSIILGVTIIFNFYINYKDSIIYIFHHNYPIWATIIGICFMLFLCVIFKLLFQITDKIYYPEFEKKLQKVEKSSSHTRTVDKIKSFNN
ncbi:hypothetical protein [Aliarcobacter butzleri]|uniref:hypothetical protein n=1 Tax=Aliarcobacter butzleri TaxID=28197 RepID=UPI001EDCA4F7|nr:hypothetical protein [Aliarcobacter butzleri]MCG3695424.1 hypothetical protein [Aliarcobacter butzleri]MDN5054318.1 hypothetical protein [Aliarcobacter butzleri]